MTDELGNLRKISNVGGDRTESGQSQAATGKRAVEHLADALDAEERAEKEFHIREALQLLNIEGR